MVKKKKKKVKAIPSAVRSETPVYDRLVVDTGFAPHIPPPPPGGWRNFPAQVGMLEDNFS